MNLFTNDQLTKVDTKNPTPYLSKTVTLSARTNSMTVVNFSNFGLEMIGDVEGMLGALPPFTTKTFFVSSGHQITFNLMSVGFQSSSIVTQYVGMDESNYGTESGIQPIALLPVYTQEVNIGNTPKVEFAGTQNVKFDGTQTVQVAGGVNATIQNASIKSDVTNAQIKTTNSQYVNRTNISVSLSPGTTLQLGDFPLPVSFYDGCWILITSKNRLYSSYEIRPTGTNPFVMNNLTSDGNTTWEFINVPVSPATLRSGGHDFGFFKLTTPIPATAVSLVVKNIGTSQMTDTLDIYIIARLASNDITNTSTSPIPTTNQLKTSTLSQGVEMINNQVFAPNNNLDITPYDGVYVGNAKRVVFMFQAPVTGMASNAPLKIFFWGSNTSGKGGYRMQRGAGSAAVGISGSYTSNPGWVSFDSAGYPELLGGYTYIGWGYTVPNSSASNVTINGQISSTVLIME